MLGNEHWNYSLEQQQCNWAIGSHCWAEMHYMNLFDFVKPVEQPNPHVGQTICGVWNQSQTKKKNGEDDWQGGGRVGAGHGEQKAVLGVDHGEQKAVRVLLILDQTCSDTK